MNPIKLFAETCRFVDRKTSFVDKPENWPTVARYIGYGVLGVAGCKVADEVFGGAERNANIRYMAEAHNRQQDETLL